MLPPPETVAEVVFEKGLGIELAVIIWAPPIVPGVKVQEEQAPLSAHTPQGSPGCSFWVHHLEV